MTCRGAVIRGRQAPPFMWTEYADLVGEALQRERSGDPDDLRVIWYDIFDVTMEILGVQYDMSEVLAYAVEFFLKISSEFFLTNSILHRLDELDLRFDTDVLTHLLHHGGSQADTYADLCLPGMIVAHWVLARLAPAYADFPNLKQVTTQSQSYLNWFGSLIPEPLKNNFIKTYLEQLYPKQLKSYPNS